MAQNLPGEGRPWFTRGRTRYGCGMQPSSAAGWMLTLVYVLVALGLSLLLIDRDQGPANWIAWGALMTGATVAYLLTAWRMSAPAGKDKS